MPTYDLKCRTCGHEFEKFSQNILKEDEKVCPVCRSRDVVQEYKSSPSIIDSGCGPTPSGFG